VSSAEICSRKRCLDSFHVAPHSRLHPQMAFFTKKKPEDQENKEKKQKKKSEKKPDDKPKQDFGFKAMRANHGVKLNMLNEQLEKADAEGKGMNWVDQQQLWGETQFGKAVVLANAVDVLLILSIRTSNRGSWYLAATWQQLQCYESSHSQGAWNRCNSKRSRGVITSIGSTE
jgi:hypothetical protein